MDEHVVIGMDPHKRTVTIEVVAADERILGHRQFTTDTAGFTGSQPHTGTSDTSLPEPAGPDATTTLPIAS